MILDGFEFTHDQGEMDVEKDNQFHNWDDEVDEFMPPKIDAHASDSATVNLVHVFSPTREFQDLSEIGEDESGDHSNDKPKKVTYLTTNAIEDLEKSAAGSKISKAKPLDAKSTASKKSFMTKFKVKAKDHLVASPDEIKKIAQVPLVESQRPESKREITYKDAKGKVTTKIMNAKLLDKEEDDNVILELREMLQIKVSLSIL